MKTNRMAKSTVAGITALTLALAGCSGGDSGDNADDAQNSPAATDQAAGDNEDSEAADDEASDDATQDGSASDLPADADLSKDTVPVSPEDAIRTAEKEVGDGIVHGIELDWDEKDQAWQYEVSILDGNTDHDVEIDAVSGKIVKHEQDSTDDEEKAIDLNDPMTFDEALKLAQKKASGKLVGWKLEYDDNMKEYQFDFVEDGDETEVTVDTETKHVTVDDD